MSVLSHSPFCFFGRWLSSRDDDGQIIRDLPTSDVIPGIVLLTRAVFLLLKKNEYALMRISLEAYVKVNAKG